MLYLLLISLNFGLQDFTSSNKLFVVCEYVPRTALHLLEKLQQSSGETPEDPLPLPGQGPKYAATFQCSCTTRTASNVMACQSACWRALYIIPMCSANHELTLLVCDCFCL